VPNCTEAGVLGALCGVIGSLQALEALKLAAGFGTPLLGRLLLVDALGANFRTLALAPDPACPACGPAATLRELRAENYATTCAAPAPAQRQLIVDVVADAPAAEVPLEISVEETKRLLDTRPDEVVLIDVREPYELAICRIAGSEAIPMREIPARVDDLPRDKHLLIHCHSGMRSMRVTEYLRAQGFPAVSNVGGGIAAWAARIEPGMARY
jgi:adenylyltransferase/sulfurtransferase